MSYFEVGDRLEALTKSVPVIELVPLATVELVRLIHALGAHQRCIGNPFCPPLGLSQLFFDVLLFPEVGRGI